MKQQMYEAWFKFMQTEGDPSLMEVYADAALAGVDVEVVKLLPSPYQGPPTYTDSTYYFDTLQQHNDVLVTATDAANEAK
tara:strand:+ start:7809 stop:8048 length:240 start_codon:yes stop_codon:yes gene_type:complete